MRRFVHKRSRRLARAHEVLRAALLFPVAVACKSPASAPDANSITQVVVVPESVTVSVGKTAQLAATPKDASGNGLTGISLMWASKNTAVATVSATGLVMGVATGTDSITVTGQGHTASALVTVTPAVPASTTLFHESFADTAFASRGWYDNTSLTIADSEHIVGSTAALEAHFLLGATTPTWGGAMRHLFTATPTLYVSYWVKYSANWIGSGVAYHPHEFTMLSDQDGPYDGPSDNYLTLYLEQNYQNGGIPRMAWQDSKLINTSRGTPPVNLIGVTTARSTGGCNGVSESTSASGDVVSSCYAVTGNDPFPDWYNAVEIDAPGETVSFQPNPGTGYKSNWNHVEAYYQINSIVNGTGQPDGVMEYWFNGSLVIDRHDILYRAGASININQFLIAPYIGVGSPVDQTMWVDDLTVATAHP